MVKTLSKAAEDQVVEAVKQAVNLVDDQGLAPTAAITTVAKQAGWGPDMIRFVSRAYNTGRQTAQQLAGKTAKDKFAEFPLADAEQAIRDIFATKTATDYGVATEYDRPPVFHLQRDQALRNTELRSMVKAATCACPVCGKDPCEGGCTHTRTDATSYSQAVKEKNKMKQARDEARLALSTTADRLLDRLGHLANYFRKSAMDRLPFAVVDAAVRAWHGSPGVKLMDWVHERGCPKEARDRSREPLKLACDWNQEPYNLVRECLSLGKQTAVARERLARFDAQLTKHAQEKLSPFVSPSVTRSSPSADGESLLGDDAAWLKNASPSDVLIPAAVGIGTKELLDQALTGGAPADRRVETAWSKLEDPAHDTALRRIRNQAMMADLMDDEIIGSYDPDTVLARYNDIATMAPRVAQQPVAMRTLLRRHLQGGIEPFEAKEISELEKNLLATEIGVVGPEKKKKPDASSHINILA